MFIQQTLCELAEGFPTRDSLEAPAALIRPVKPMAAAPAIEASAFARDEVNSYNSNARCREGGG